MKISLVRIIRVATALLTGVLYIFSTVQAQDMLSPLESTRGVRDTLHKIKLEQIKTQTLHQDTTTDIGKWCIDFRTSLHPSGNVGLYLPIGQSMNGKATNKEIASMAISTAYAFALFVIRESRRGNGFFHSYGFGLQFYPNETGASATANVTEATFDVTGTGGYVFNNSFKPYIILCIGLALMWPANETLFRFTNSTGPTSTATVSGTKPAIHAAVGAGSVFDFTQRISSVIEVAYDVRGNYGLPRPPNLEESKLAFSCLSLTAGLRYYLK